MAVAVVGELVVGSRELLEALGGDAGEISGELRVLGQNHSAPSHEAVDQRLLPHLTPPKTLTLYHRPTKAIATKASDTKTESQRRWDRRTKCWICTLRNGFSTPVVYIVLLIYISIFIFRERERIERERGLPLTFEIAEWDWRKCDLFGLVVIWGLLVHWTNKI